VFGRDSRRQFQRWLDRPHLPPPTPTTSLGKLIPIEYEMIIGKTATLAA
jgi:hypothetical protein